MYRFGKYSFSSIEIKHLFIAMMMIILTLFVFQNKNFFKDLSVLFSGKFLLFFIVYFFTIGLGFILHELGHKLVAQYYGHISEFRADFQMLIFMFLLALLSPIIFLAPGAVLIHGRVTIKQNGIISVAGPLVNLCLALIFFLIALIFNDTGMFSTVLQLGIWVNAFLGIFNMLPFWILDGKKVLQWNVKVYAAVMTSLVFFLLAPNAFGLF